MEKTKIRKQLMIISTLIDVTALLLLEIGGVTQSAQYMFTGAVWMIIASIISLAMKKAPISCGIAFCCHWIHHSFQRAYLTLALAAKYFKRGFHEQIHTTYKTAFWQNDTDIHLVRQQNQSAGNGRVDVPRCKNHNDYLKNLGLI